MSSKERSPVPESVQQSLSEYQAPEPTPSAVVLGLEYLQAYLASLLHHSALAIGAAVAEVIALKQRVPAVEKHFSHASLFFASAIVGETENLARLVTYAVLQTLTCRILAAYAAAILLGAVASSPEILIQRFRPRPEFELADEGEVGGGSCFVDVVAEGDRRSRNLSEALGIFRLRNFYDTSYYDEEAVENGSTRTRRWLSVMVLGDASCRCGCR